MQYNTSYETYSSSSRDSPSKAKGKDDKSGYFYKKAAYQYSGTGNKNNSYINSTPEQNIDQLDALLEDLKNERQMTREKDLLSTSGNSRTLEQSEPYGKITKTTRTVKTHQTGQSPIDVETYTTSDYSTLKSNSNLNETLRREEKVYSDLSTPRSFHESQSKIYESTRNVNNLEVIPPTTTVTARDIETDLKNIALTDDILPLPGTKVTTTVRTYTYEIPAGTLSNTSTLNRNQNILYKNYQQNEIQNLHEPQPHPVKHIPNTVVYNTESYSTINKGTERPIVSNQSYEVHEHRETNTIRNRELSPVRPELPGKSEMVFRVKTTENVQTVSEPSSKYPVSGNTITTTEYNNTSPNYHPAPVTGTTHTTTEYNNSSPNYPPGPTTSRYFYKETSNVTNTIRGPNNMPDVPSTYRPPIDHSPSYPPPRDTGYPPHTSNVSYKYTTSSTTNTRGGSDYPSPNSNLPPAPFPVDGADYPLTNGNPPRRVDDLMQSFGHSDAVDKSDIETPHRKREIETAVASPNEPQIPSVNRAGKEVYYPPGHETMLQKREEYAAGSAAGGRWAKGSGMYEYESGYKSKSKSKSGGAMVPVCLPLCCAMPCSIM